MILASQLTKSQHSNVIIKNLLLQVELLLKKNRNKIFLNIKNRVKRLINKTVFQPKDSNKMHLYNRSQTDNELKKKLNRVEQK